jgi:hypothetical protein
MSEVLELSSVSKAAFNAAFDALRDLDLMPYLPAAFTAQTLQPVVQLTAAATPSRHHMCVLDECAHQLSPSGNITSLAATIPPAG